MKTQDVVKKEYERTDKSTWNTIHLYKEGNFYRAYEWSAWITSIAYCNKNKENKDAKPLTVSRKKIKSVENDYCFIGFPTTSLEKFIPENIGFNTISDTEIEIKVQVEFPEGTTYENLKASFESWKNSFTIKEETPYDESKKKASGSEHSGYGGPTSLTKIMSKILAYPLESRSPKDNIEFISNLKQELASLI